MGPLFSIGILAVVITLATYVFSLCFIVWMMIDALMSRKYLWFFGILVFPLIGAIVYFFTEKKHDYGHIPPITT